MNFVKQPITKVPQISVHACVCVLGVGVGGGGVQTFCYIQSLRLSNWQRSHTLSIIKATQTAINFL